METLKVAVVGVGFWGRNHARVYSTMQDVELVAVVDTNVQTAAQVAKSYGCEYYPSVVELLKHGHVDAASICTPSSTHAQASIELIKGGVSLLVEKPLTETLEQGVNLVKEAERARITGTVGFIERFNPAVMRIKQMITDGKIGSPILFYSKRVSSWPERIGDVGVVKDLSIHDLDLVRFIFEKEVESVYAVVDRSRKGVHEDFANILLRLQASTAFVESNWLTPYKERRLVVTGSQATVSANYITQEVSIASAEGVFTPVVKSVEPLKLELENFVKCIRQGTSPSPTLMDGLKALALADAALLSSAKGAPVKPAY